jgi:protein phosphatase
MLKSEAEMGALTGISEEKQCNNHKSEKGPFDIIGDVHGCMDELCDLLELLGYTIQRVPEAGQNYGFKVTPPEGRRAVFVGDLVDRGPDSVGVLRLVMSMVHAGNAFCVPGNHDDKLRRFLAGRAVKVQRGLETTVAQLEQESPAFKTELEGFLKGLISHYVFDEGRLVVAHAGVREEMQGVDSGAVRAFCMYGETTGEIDEFGLPVRGNWAESYSGAAKVVYGHTPVLEAEWFNRTIDIDTGCVYGGKLTALRYPEETLVSVPARMEYYQPARPLQPGPIRH